jgi:hypothetical protein
MATQVSDNYTVTSIQARKALLKAFEVKRPVFLWGPPGIGKSDVVAQVTKDLGGFMIDLRMAQMEPTDLRGIPFYNKDNGRMDWAPPIDLPDQELASQYPIVVLFLDEMNSAAPAVQAAGYQLILNRRVGKYVLPDNVVIVAAGNRESDKGVTYRMPMPLSNRFIHVEMRSDFASWQQWAVLRGAHKDVVGYLSFAKQDLYDFDNKSSSRAFATPRSWMFVSDLLNGDTDAETLYTLIAGAIGEGLAAKFQAHRKFSAQLPEPMEVLTGKVTDLKVKEVSAMYSLTVSLCYELKDIMANKRADRTKFNEMMNNFLSYMMKNFETELVIMGARIAIKTYDLPMEPSKLACFDEFHKKFGKYILDAAR